MVWALGSVAPLKETRRLLSEVDVVSAISAVDIVRIVPAMDRIVARATTQIVLPTAAVERVFAWAAMIAMVLVDDDAIAAHYRVTQGGRRREDGDHRQREGQGSGDSVLRQGLPYPSLVEVESVIPKKFAASSASASLSGLTAMHGTTAIMPLGT